MRSSLAFGAAVAEHGYLDTGCEGLDQVKQKRVA